MYPKGVLGNAYPDTRYTQDALDRLVGTAGEAVNRSAGAPAERIGSQPQPEVGAVVEADVARADALGAPERANT
jgi:hypothetical protein